MISTLPWKNERRLFDMEVKVNNTGQAAWLMKASCICAAASIVAIAISFGFAVKSVKYFRMAEQYKQDRKGLYYYQGQPLDRIDIKTAHEVERSCQWEGCVSALQDLTHRWNMRFTRGSVICLIASVCLFGIGVYLL